MAPKSKLLARRRRAPTDARESSRGPSERRSKHREDRLPELIGPQGLRLIRPNGTFKKIVQSRYVDFESLAPMFPSLLPYFDTQGWTSFLYSHLQYSPTAVSEFYNNLGLSDQGDIYSSVKGTRFRLTANLLSTALEIPNSGVEIFNYNPSASEYYELLTLEPYDTTKEIARLNANSFPPLIRMIHHIFTTLIVLKDGSRELVTEVHKSLFIFFLKCQEINLPELMISLIRRCFSNTKRSMPYACPITSLLIFLGIPIPPSELISLKSRSAFDLTAANRMGYKIVDGVVTRTLKGKEPQGADVSTGEEDNEDDEANEGSDEDPQDEQMPDQAQEFDDVPVPPQQSVHDYLAQIHQEMISGFAQMTSRFDQVDARLNTLDDRLDHLYSERDGSRHPPSAGHDNE